MWETEEGRGRDKPSNKELVSDLGVGLCLGCPVTQFLHLEPLFSAQSLLPTPKSRKEPQCKLRLNCNNNGELDRFTCDSVPGPGVGGGACCSYTVGPQTLYLSEALLG